MAIRMKVGLFLLFVISSAILVANAGPEEEFLDKVSKIFCCVECSAEMDKCVAGLPEIDQKKYRDEVPKRSEYCNGKEPKMDVINANIKKEKEEFDKKPEAERKAELERMEKNKDKFNKFVECSVNVKV